MTPRSRSPMIEMTAGAEYSFSRNRCVHGLTLLCRIARIFAKSVFSDTLSSGTHTSIDERNEDASGHGAASVRLSCPCDTHSVTRARHFVPRRSSSVAACSARKGVDDVIRRLCDTSSRYLTKSACIDAFPQQVRVTQVCFSGQGRNQASPHAPSNTAERRPPHSSACRSSCVVGGRVIMRVCPSVHCVCVANLARKRYSAHPHLDDGCCLGSSS